MAEETQVLSIKDRIAALNQNHVGRSPAIPPSSRPLAIRNKTVNNPPCNVNGSVLDNASIGNQPASITTERAKAPAPPPPLPTRRSSTQPAPALPPRRPSGEPSSRRTSQASISASSVDSNTRPLRAPAWGETELPPLPPRREEANTARPSVPQRRSQSIKSSEPLKGVLPPPRTRSPPAPRLPPRRESADDPGPSTRTVPTPPPRLPSRNHNVQHEQAANGLVRKLPPPPPSDVEVDKIRQSGLGSLKNTGNGGDQTRPPANGVPPPVPLSSRPDLSKIQATKPRMQTSVSPTAGCLKCRDFSEPDAHAARYPRESLPTQDLAWLARELTAPFPSLTDKARAIFTWLHHNISYDVNAFFNNNVKPSTPASTLTSGLAVCEGYAGLFTALATHAGLESLVISGHGKGYGYSPLAAGSPLPPYSANHAWNVVKIDNGHWKLIDACWGAGAVNGPSQPYIRRFEPAMFTSTNDEFGLKHFPGNKDHFFRDDGRPSISWEEYMMGDGIEPPHIFGDAAKYHIGERTLRPACRKIPVSVHQQQQSSSAGPIRFSFGLICEHWSLERHSKRPSSLFLLIVNGLDGKKSDQIPFIHVPGPFGSGGGGGGDMWYVDIDDPRVLGTPNQTLMLAVLTTFGDREDSSGLTAEEFRRGKGRVGMSWAGVATWELV